MNLVFASYNLKDPEAWRLALGTERIISVRGEDKLRSFADVALELDKLIYFEKYPVDWVLYCNNEKGVQWAEFLAIEPYFDRKADTVILTHTKTSERQNDQIPDLSGNFYCRPHVFSMLGGLYKLQISDSSILKETRVSTDDTKILYGITRAGFNIKLL